MLLQQVSLKQVCTSPRPLVLAKVTCRFHSAYPHTFCPYILPASGAAKLSPARPVPGPFKPRRSPKGVPGETKCDSLLPLFTFRSVDTNYRYYRHLPFAPGFPGAMVPASE